MWMNFEIMHRRITFSGGVIVLGIVPCIDLGLYLSPEKDLERERDPPDTVIDLPRDYDRQSPPDLVPESGRVNERDLVLDLDLDYEASKDAERGLGFKLLVKL
ncbi:MAG: hypothetical protein EZS28_023881 [Streblomastix strix]|uniref:Uncharacterized protein n=1 Tax=Streblomastix strix TaxID=222440 RepID=A0A5J4VDR5_9EUKA|nr:MAG: hypothetical protein EZS28_023881 [Streblomastix strix]